MSLTFGKTSDELIFPIQVTDLGEVVTIPSSSFPSIPDSNIVRYQSPALSAGFSNHDIFTVPSGEVHRVKIISCIYLGTTAGVLMNPRIIRGATDCIFVSLVNFTSAQAQIVNLDILAIGGDVIRVALYGATAGNTILVSLFSDRIK